MLPFSQDGDPSGCDFDLEAKSSSDGSGISYVSLRLRKTVGATVLVVTNGYKEVREIYIFAGVLVLQSLPFLAAVSIALLENSRVNCLTFAGFA